MLYLIKSNNLIKIGYTENIHTRMQNYNTHNPDVELLGIREGDKNLEDYYHYIFRNRHIKGEWFKLPEYIVNYLVTHQFTTKEISNHSDKTFKNTYHSNKNLQKENDQLLIELNKCKDLIKSLYTKMIITRITNDVNNLSFTEQEEYLLHKYKYYNPNLNIGRESE